MKYFSAALILLVTVLYLEAVLSTEIPSPPKIVKQPDTAEILVKLQTEDEEIPIFLPCDAIGEPIPKYSWLKNGKPFVLDSISQIIGRGTLVFHQFQQSDFGQYQCFAENEFGIATANSVFLRENYLRSFKDIKSLFLVGNEGEPFKLTCDPPTAYSKLHIQWIIQYPNENFKTINNSRITVDPKGNLWFSNLTKEDSSEGFSYRCVASSYTRLEFKLGNKVNLNVRSSDLPVPSHAPVLQYVTRRNEVAVRGKNIELYCIFGGNPLPQMEWLKNGNVIIESDHIFKQNYGKSLFIKQIQFEDEGTYTCKADNGVSESQEYSIHLVILAAPYFTIEPESVTASLDETAEIECVASGIPVPSIKWLHNGKRIEETRSNPRRTFTENKIVIEGLTKGDTGNYGCNASNALGYVYKDVFVNVLALPPQILAAYNKQVVVGNDVSLSCVVSAAPKRTIKWVHENQELLGNRYIVSQKGDLLIKNVKMEDAGQYKCIAANLIGEASIELTLTVNNA